jgi:hypothetical protein
VALLVESEGRAAALGDGALWAVFDALTACGASPGDGGDCYASRDLGTEWFGSVKFYL